MGWIALKFHGQSVAARSEDQIVKAAYNPGLHLNYGLDSPQVS